MGTRGAYGFYKNGVTKVMYNHFDSYPEHLGQKVGNFIAKTSKEELDTIFDNIEMVEEGERPTELQIQYCLKYGTEEMKKHLQETLANDRYAKYLDWYHVLRPEQGNLELFKTGFRYMADAEGFLYNSLFCEWAYIINLDTYELEVYEGFNKDIKAEGRYKTLIPEPDQEYFAVRLIQTIPLDRIKDGEDVVKAIYAKSF